MTSKFTTLFPIECKCGSGMFNDRMISKEDMGCPACDKELGDKPEERIELYKKLISYPVRSVDFLK